ncbi:CPBP family intramembrane glutamic endopeptidase [Brevundimonas sp.]|uniref:CPBP family intramembrane glutamic endopeptidase n=1 Tax=Brevundimonas sp. TaxID=1871086 RepID=UPI002CB4BF37|nr:CPBP family intramembrane glutamic endopeptidase [Brevundimonas sp.]HWQ86649.1 CPBP family intramembrane glutamic endopeptidase [Brevundimonas sp.]
MTTSPPDTARRPDFPARSPWLVSALVISVFLVVNAIGLTPFRTVAGDWEGWSRIAALAVLGYGLYLIGPLLTASLLFGRSRALDALGLSGSLPVALGLAGGCSLIVLVGIAVSSPLAEIGRLPLELVRSALLPGLAEELLFRAFLFGFLYRFAGWGFAPAALLSAAVFGAEHLYQGGDLVEAGAIAVLTGIGGLWWSWLLVEWRWNAWVPIAFHVLLNAFWTAFDVSDSALGGGREIGLRLACMALSIGVTIIVASRRGGLRIRGRRWWLGEAGQAA